MTGRRGTEKSSGGNGGNGVGLANVRARLGRLYGAAWRLELSPGGAGGTLAIPGDRLATPRR